MQAPAVLLLCVALPACGLVPAKERVVIKTQKVEVPVYIRPAPPAWLLEPLFEPGEQPEIFVAPDDPDAVLGVSKKGLESFWQVLDRSAGRIEAWQAWALEPAGTGVDPK